MENQADSDSDWESDTEPEAGCDHDHDPSDHNDGHHPVLDIELGTRLVTACRTGDTWHVAECLASPPARLAPHLDTALVEAARSGHGDVVEMLVARPETDVNYSDGDGDTALSHACCCGHYAVVKLLLSAPNIDINTTDGDRVSPLHKAIANNHRDVVQLLLNQTGLRVSFSCLLSQCIIYFCQVNAQNKYGFSALILAAGMGNLEIVRLLVTRPGVDVNLVESNSCSALMIACMHGYCEVAATILEREDCDVNIGTGYCGQPTRVSRVLCSVQLRLHVSGDGVLQEPPERGVAAADEGGRGPELEVGGGGQPDDDLLRPQLQLHHPAAGQQTRPRHQLHGPEVGHVTPDV